MGYRYPYSKMVNGRPVEVTSTGYINTTLITDLSEENQKKIFNWINLNILPRKTCNRDHTSYGLKHLLEEDTGLYLTNNQFKDATLMAGFKPYDYNDLNWNFCISEKPLTKRLKRLSKKR